MRKRGKQFSRRVDKFAAFRAADRQHPLDATQKRTLGVALRTHLEALRTGRADAYAFHNLANAVNTSMVMAERGLGEQFGEQIGGAQQAMIRLHTNGHRGRWLLDGPSLNALKAWLEVYEAQLDVASQQEAIEALEEVHRRIARGQVFEDQRSVA